MASKPVKQPRAKGDVVLSSRPHGAMSVIGDLRQAGSLKAVFPRPQSAALDCVLVNTAGGITGGDTFSTKATASTNSHLCLTTQAAERAYRAQPGEVGTVRNTLHVQANAQLEWLPQETILFNGCDLRRHLSVDMHATARLTLCEPMIFGRAAMGETVTKGRLHDRITITRSGETLFHDAINLNGNIAAHLARPHIADGAMAMATLIHIAPNAEAHLALIRAGLGPTAGASLIRDDLLFLRLLAQDGFELRKTLIPVLTRLLDAPLPRPWMI